MKNNILIILFIFYQILFFNKVFAKEIEFDASDIEISDNQNLTIANNGIVNIKDDRIIVEGVKIKYFKNRSLIVVEQGKISKIDKFFEIKSNTIEYFINDGKINFLDKVKINDLANNLIINSESIKYDISNELIFSENKSRIIDELNNTYELNKFEYS